MLEDKIINEIANFVADKVDSAEMLIDGVAEEVNIMNIQVVENNLLKVFITAAQGKGEITDIRLKDIEGDIIMSKPRSVIKNPTFGLVSTFYIRFIEMEVNDPINIFEMGGRV